MTLQKKICMLGSFGVGKTSLVSQFVHSIFSEKYLSTIGVKIDKKVVPLARDRDVNLILWDLAGDDHFDRLKSSYLKGSSGFLLVVDGCRRETLTVAEGIVERESESLGGLPFVCVINKADLEVDWEVQPEDIARLRAKGWEVVALSASWKDQVDDLFTRFAARITRSSAATAQPATLAR
ncbi:MAG: Rab family GTPase [Verrucomicrobiota bacterium]